VETTTGGRSNERLPAPTLCAWSKLGAGVVLARKVPVVCAARYPTTINSYAGRFVATERPANEILADDSYGVDDRGRIRSTAIAAGVVPSKGIFPWGRPQVREVGSPRDCRKRPLTPEREPAEADPRKAQYRGKEANASTPMNRRLETHLFADHLHAFGAPSGCPGGASVCITEISAPCGPL